MGNQYDSVITAEQEKAIALIRESFTDIKGLQEELGIGSYQYARTLVANDQYGLSTNSIELFGRVYISKAAVENAKSMRDARQEERANQRAEKESQVAEKKSGAGKKGKKGKAAEAPEEDLEELLGDK